MAIAVRSRGKGKTKPHTSRSRSARLNVIALLKNDHREVQDMFDKVEKLGERATEQRRKLGERICQALELHSKFEENVFYPQIRERAEDHEERKQLLEALEEHAIVDRLVEELKGMDATDERYEAKLNVVAEAVRHHIKEEEREMFPLAREMFEPEELAQMGERLAEEKRNAGMPVA